GAFDDSRGECAPAAADFQHPFAATDPEQVDDAVQLALLRFLQGLPRRGVDRRRIGQARIEPQAVELIAEIVMGGDVASTAAPGVPVERMTQSGPRQRRLQALERWRVAGAARRGAQERVDIWCRPFTREISFGE